MLESGQRRSSVWRFVEVLNEQKARCVVCRAVLRYRCVSNLRKHFKRLHPHLAPSSGAGLTAGASKVVKCSQKDKHTASGDDENVGEETEQEDQSEQQIMEEIYLDESEITEDLPEEIEQTRVIKNYSHIAKTPNIRAHDKAKKQGQRRPKIRRIAQPVSADSSDSDEQFVSPKKRTKKSADSADTVEIFGRYVTALMKQLPKELFQRLQVDIVTLILSKQMEFENRNVNVGIVTSNGFQANTGDFVTGSSDGGAGNGDIGDVVVKISKF